MEAVHFYRLKNEVRILGFDDFPFNRFSDKKTRIVGTIFRGGYFMDGLVSTEVEVDGTDATRKIAELLKRTRRRDIRIVMLDGLGFAGFNLVNIRELFLLTGYPVIAVTRRYPDIQRITQVIEKLDNKEFYLQCIHDAGEIHSVESRSGKHIFIQIAGLSLSDAKSVVRISTTHSDIPEPLRVAHIIASGIGRGDSKGRA